MRKHLVVSPLIRISNAASTQLLLTKILHAMFLLLRSKPPSIIHQNLPLLLVLEAHVVLGFNEMLVFSLGRLFVSVWQETVLFSD